jgi:hypothetical protein
MQKVNLKSVWRVFFSDRWKGGKYHLRGEGGGGGEYDFWTDIPGVSRITLTGNSWYQKLRNPAGTGLPDYCTASGRPWALGRQNRTEIGQDSPF